MSFFLPMDGNGSAGESSRMAQDRQDTLAPIPFGDIFYGQSTPRSTSLTGEEDANGDRKKKQKISRATNACIPCRTRKCRCQISEPPPAACASCVKDEMKCEWPTKDGRSAEARKIRNKRKQSEPKSANETNATWADMIDTNWIQDLDGSATHKDLSSVSMPTMSDSSLLGINPFALTDPMQSFTTGTGLTPDSNQNMTPDWWSMFDPAQVVMALSSQLPTVEESSTYGDPPSGPLPITLGTTSSPATKVRSEDKVVKLTWWRPHGQTAIAPGLQRIILKVRVQQPGSLHAPTPPSFGDVPTLVGPDRMPHPVVMKHLLQLFMEHFGCQFPFLDQSTLESAIDNRGGSVFLFLCIAAVAARFSTHPLIALDHLQPHEYGNVFYAAAKELLGSMMSVPSRETVIGLILMSHVGLGIDSESEEWMFVGMAVRMAIDLGLQYDPPEESQIPPDERRSNRLVFWSVVLLDFALAFGTGRQPTIRVEEITQLLPMSSDLTELPGLTSPFPYAARQMLAYGQLITVLNSNRVKSEEMEKAIVMARSRAIQVYNALPQDLQWNVTNLQRYSQVGQASMYLHLHLWMHTIIASGYLTDTDLLRRGIPSATASSTPNTVAASNLWRNSARTIGDVLVLSDIINPNSYLSLPFCNQAFHVAGCCYVKEIEQGSSGGTDKKPSELFKSLLTSVAANNISTVQQGLSKQTKYWAGIAWVAETLAQRVSGINANEIDLATVTEKLSSSVYVADAGVLNAVTGTGAKRMGRDEGIDANANPSGLAALPRDSDLGEAERAFLEDWAPSTRIDT